MTRGGRKKKTGKRSPFAPETDEKKRRKKRTRIWNAFRESQARREGEVDRKFNLLYALEKEEEPKGKK